MPITNIECKIKVEDINVFEKKLQILKPVYIGEDHQKDTYYNTETGRLKLREGNIENALIWYNREDVANVKQSDILLYKHQPDESLKKILKKLHNILVVVDKVRKIYFVENVKFHFDKIEGLGEFIEIEAIDKDGTIPIEKLKKQCAYYINFFGLNDAVFIEYSYSDLLMNNK